MLPNAWDVASARLVEDAGASAIATTSAGMAWALGYADGGHMKLELAVSAAGRMVREVSLPVSVDIENGYGDSPADVHNSVAAFLNVGIVGINLEDSLRPVDEQAGRLRAARSAADQAQIPLFINARIDTHRLGGIGNTEWLKETLDRAAVYLEAGANGIFVLGALTAETISLLSGELAAPLNVAVGPGTLTVQESADAGASRISAGSSIAEAAYSLAGRAAVELLNHGTVSELDNARSYAEINTLLGK